MSILVWIFHTNGDFTKKDIIIQNDWINPSQINDDYKDIDHMGGYTISCGNNEYYILTHNINDIPTNCQNIHFKLPVNKALQSIYPTSTILGDIMVFRSIEYKFIDIEDDLNLIKHKIKDCDLDNIYFNEQ